MGHVDEPIFASTGRRGGYSRKLSPIPCISRPSRDGTRTGNWERFTSSGFPTPKF